MDMKLTLVSLDLKQRFGRCHPEEPAKEPPEKWKNLSRKRTGGKRTSKCSFKCHRNE
jgi:hypothetical protein